MNLIKVICLFCYTFLFTTVIAQDKPNEYWDNVADRIINKKDLLQLKAELGQQLQQSNQNLNPVTYVNSLYYRLRVQDLITEDSLYFKNSAFIDSNLNNTSTPKTVKRLLHLMQAKRLDEFFRGSRKFNYKLYAIPANAIAEYPLLVGKKRDSIIQYHYQMALKYQDEPLITKRLVLPWVLGKNTDLLWMDYTLTDLSYYSYINYLYVIKRYEDINIVHCQKISAASENELWKTVNENLSVSNWIKLFSDWKNSSNGKTELIGFLLRKQVYQHYSYDSLISKNYSNFLQNQLSNRNENLKAFATFHYSVNLINRGSSYNQNPQDVNRLLIKEGVNLFEKNSLLLKKFTQSFTLLSERINQVKLPYFTVEAEDIQLPHQAIQLKISYKNQGILHYKIVSEGLLKNTKEYLVQAFSTMQAVKQDTIFLPSTDDYQQHRLVHKLDGLPSGNYTLIIADQSIADQIQSIHALPFKVTEYVLINSNQRAFVLNRRTGKPIAGAKITGYMDKPASGKTKAIHQLIGDYVTNSQGFADVDFKVNKLHAVVNNQHFVQNFEANGDSYPDEIYNEDDYDDLMEYHSEQVRLHVFTDRGIYRPGQQVHFKLMLLTNNPQTGQLMVFNKQNVGTKIFAKFLELNEKEPHTMFIEDANGKKIYKDTIDLDEFGCFSGSYSLPQKASTGTWSIGLNEVEGANYHSGEFKVEEYKRPTFDVKIDKNTEMLWPGKPFSATVKVTALNGVPLSKVSLKYNVTRSTYHSITKNKGPLTNFYLDSNVVSNEKGEYIISINDTTLKQLTWNNKENHNFYYQIHVTAVDQNGESHNADAKYQVSNRPITLRLGIDSKMDSSKKTSFAINAYNQYSGNLNKTVHVKIAKQYDSPDRNYRYYYFPVDIWKYSNDSLRLWFPEISTGLLNPFAIGNKIVEPIDTIPVFVTTLETGKQNQVSLATAHLKPGDYKIEAFCYENGQLLGQTSQNFQVINTAQLGQNQLNKNWIYTSEKVCHPKQSVEIFSENVHPVYAIYELIYPVKLKDKQMIKHTFIAQEENSGLNSLKFNIPANCVNRLQIVKSWVRNNEIERYNHELVILNEEDKSTAKPEIVIKSYKKVISPGEKTEFTVSVKTKNRNYAVQLMSTLYDASLDRLHKLNWDLPNTNRIPNWNLNSHWPNSIHKNTVQVSYRKNLTSATATISAHDLEQLSANQLNDNVLNGRLAGIDVSSGDPGIGMSIRIRGTSSLFNEEEVLVILDGEVYQGDINSINVNTVKDIKMLTGADAVAVFGSRAAKGVIVISTKGLITFPSENVEAQTAVRVRSNFNESAFFMPKVYASKDGLFHFQFTLPESLTEWRWMLFGHTKDAKFMYTERLLHSRLNLSLQANVPRSLYQSDSVFVKSRISNLDSVAVNGNLEIQLWDAVTGANLTSAFCKTDQQQVAISAKKNVAYGFWLHVPSHQLNPIKVVLKVVTKGRSDAEEHLIPIYSKKMFLVQTENVALSAGSSIKINAPQLPANAIPYAIGLSVGRHPQQELLNSLSWLSNYSFDCAEQTFNKWLANVTALHLLKKDIRIKNLLNNDQLSNIPDKDTNKLPNQLDKAELPWLNLADKEKLESQQILELLDSVKLTQSINQHWERLKKLQNSDGGLTWFDGGISNYFISSYILRSLGLAVKSGIVEWNNSNTTLNTFTQQLLKYVILNYSAADNGNDLIYGASFWLNFLDKKEKDQLDSIAIRNWKNADELPLAQQAQLISASYRLFAKADPNLVKAANQLDRVLQRAIYDEQNGLRWKEIADDDNLNYSKEGIMANVSEAFSYSLNGHKHQSDILKWIVRTKNEGRWRSTIATAAITHMLVNANNGGVEPVQSFKLDQNQAGQISVSNNLTNASTFISKKVDQFQEMNLTNTSAINGTASMHYYYFAENSTPKNEASATQLSRKLYLVNGTTEKEVTPDYIFKVGDQIRVELQIFTRKPLQYVFIDEKRPALCEPSTNLSEYVYQRNIGFYQSVRDNGLQLFADVIPSGLNTISYQIKVEKEGNCLFPPGVLQCMYQPDKVVYSGSFRLSCK